MNYSSVFKKSDLGREEIKYQRIGVLPRQARTLLIMIDGKRTYQNYLDSLDQGKMFASFGGIKPLLELLLDLGCIEIAGFDSVVPKSSQFIEPAKDVEPSIKRPEKEFDQAFNSQKFEAINSSNMTSSQSSGLRYETLKSELATFIEQRALPEEAWGYLLNVEQCNNSEQLLTLAKNIQSAGNSSLSRGMSDFLKKVKPRI